MGRLVRPRPALFVGLALVVVVTVLAVQTFGSSPGGTPDVPRAAVATQGAAVRDPEAEALEAGVRFATLMAGLFPLDPAAARRAVEVLASDAYRPTLTAAVEGELLPLQRRVAALPGRPVYRQSVLATRLVSHEPRRARVGSWVMLVAGQAEVDGNAMATFATVTVDLVFERGAWRLDGTAESVGPSPQVGDAPSTVDVLVSRLDGFADWRPRR